MGLCGLEDALDYREEADRGPVDGEFAQKERGDEGEKGGMVTASPQILSVTVLN